MCVCACVCVCMCVCGQSVLFAHEVSSSRAVANYRRMREEQGEKGRSEDEKTVGGRGHEVESEALYSA